MTYASPVEIPLIAGESSNQQPSSLNIYIAVGTVPGSSSTAVTLQGPKYSVQIDTGSCGAVVDASFFFVNGEAEYNQATKTFGGTLLDGVTLTNQQQQVTYEPSNVVLNGWVFIVSNLVVGVNESDDAVAVASNVEMIGITNSEGGPHMCGIGFGRPNPYASNPMVALTTPAGDAIYPSFTLGSQSIWVGVASTSADLQATFPDAVFGMTPLTGGSASSPALWQSPQGDFGPENGGVTSGFSVLLDTGVDLAMYTTNISSFNNDIAGNSRISVSIDGTFSIDDLVEWRQDPAHNSTPDLSDFIFYNQFSVVDRTIVQVANGGSQTGFTVGPVPMEVTVKPNPAWDTPQAIVPSAFFQRTTGSGLTTNAVNIGFRPLLGNLYHFDGYLGLVGFARVSLPNAATATTRE